MVLEALLSNSIRFRDQAKSQNQVWVKVCKSGDKQCIEVVDNGLGISDEHKVNIYDMFYRGPQGNSGSGLGLFLLRDAVEKMGGTLEMNSVLGKGTTFKMVFPVA
jgi:signal transduction histidine kinase